MSVEYRTGFLAIKNFDFRQDVLRKGKELLKAGHIFNVSEKHFDGKIVIKGFCVRQGTISSAPYQMELKIGPERDVELAHCSCQAGIDGQCKHTSGLVRFNGNICQYHFVLICTVANSEKFV